jgi:hypothetical protein
MDFKISNGNVIENMALIEDGKLLDDVIITGGQLIQEQKLNLVFQYNKYKEIEQSAPRSTS